MVSSRMARERASFQRWVLACIGVSFLITYGLWEYWDHTQQWPGILLIVLSGFIFFASCWQDTLGDTLRKRAKRQRKEARQAARTKDD